MKKLILAASMALCLGLGNMVQAQTTPKTFPTATTNAQNPTPVLTAATSRIMNTMNLITLALSQGTITKAQAQPLWSQLQTAMQQLVSDMESNAVGHDLTSAQATSLNQALDTVNASLPASPIQTPVVTPQAP